MTEEKISAGLQEHRRFDPFAWNRTVRVTCHTNCSYQRHCTLTAFIKDDKVLRLEQATDYPPFNDPDVPDWAPRGCQKGLVWANRMYHSSRVLSPLKRVGERGSGKWQRVSWDEALTEIADTMIDVLCNDGPDTIVLFGGSGGGVSSEGLSYDALMQKLGIPASNPTGEVGDDHNGAAQVFGHPFQGCSADNWYYADMILIWGGNPSYTNINNYHFITEARYKGTKVVTISPDFSPSAVPADLWIPVNIGSDAALCLAMAQVIIKEGLYKGDFIREQTDFPLLVRNDTRRYLRESDLKRGGKDDQFYFWDAKDGKLKEALKNSLVLGDAEPVLEGEYEVQTLRGKVRVKPVLQLLKEHVNEKYTPEQAAKVCGVAPRLIEQFAREFAAAKGVVNISTFNWGKFYHGGLIERSIIMVFALCGHMGRKGATYNAFTMLTTDATITNVIIRGSIMLRSAAAADPRYQQWKHEGLTDEQITLEYAREAWAQDKIQGTSLFHYVHSGLLQLSEKHNSWDPNLKRPVAEYVKEAFDKGWQNVIPKRGKDPKMIFNMGGSTLRRARATDVILNTLLPKLKMLVAIDTRMNSTDLYADYVLPAANWFEKWSFPGLVKPEFPYAHVINKAVEPLGESKSEWWIGCRLAEKIQGRAKERGLLTFKDANGVERHLDNVYDQVTANGTYNAEDDEDPTRDYYTNADNVEQIPWEEVKARGWVAATGTGKTARSIGNACDITPGETVIPFTNHIVKKEPYPTQSRRMQFYIDHELYLELGQELPVHLEGPKAGGDYPLRVTGGHARWSVQSNHIDDPILLRLQRGQPAMFMNSDDAEARGIKDGDMVEARNDLASFQSNVIVSPLVKPGQVIIYHGWENFQFPGWKHFKSVMASPLNPIELAGDTTGHIRPWSVSMYPGFSDRDTRVEVRKADGSVGAQ